MHASMFALGVAAWPGLSAVAVALAKATLIRLAEAMANKPRLTCRVTPIVWMYLWLVQSLARVVPTRVNGAALEDRSSMIQSGCVGCRGMLVISNYL